MPGAELGAAHSNSNCLDLFKLVLTWVKTFAYCVSDLLKIH